MKLLSTPSGFRDILPDEAAEREKIQRSVQDLFASHGFAPIETPTLEVMDVMNASGRMPTSPFRFFDSRGDLLAMRPDVTLQVARMCAARMPATEQSARFRYTQRVFRDPDGRQDIAPREIKQMGVECIGERGTSIDAELVELFAQAISVSGVNKFTIAIATVGPLRALLSKVGDNPEWKEAVLSAYHDSDFVELDKLCATESLTDFDASALSKEVAGVIAKLPNIRGGKDAIDEVRALVDSFGCADGLDELEDVYVRVSDALSKTNCDIELLVDFSAMSSFDYYTGIVFAAYAPNLGSAIGSGGRYDRLIESFGKRRDAAGFAFSVEQAMAAKEAATENSSRKLRIAVPKGALHADAVKCLAAAGLDVEPLSDIGRQLVISTDDVDYIIVRPSDAPAFVAYGAADCGICGRDSLLESNAQVVQLGDLGFGACKFVVAQPVGSEQQIANRYRVLGSIRVATKYPNITREHFSKTGVQVDIVKLNGNIELAPLTGMAERIVDITATGTTLRENNLEVVEDILSSTARFFVNPSSLRTDVRVVKLATKLKIASNNLEFKAVAGKAM